MRPLSRVEGLTGGWSREIGLPNGYQRLDWYQTGENPNSVHLNDPRSLETALRIADKSDLCLYTHHEVYLDRGLVKHTRSSPNWDGGLVTYATCKHRMRSARREYGWVGTWLVGLCPKHCADNCVLYVGRVCREFPSNRDLSEWVSQNHPDAAKAKAANTNPRGDLYQWVGGPGRDRTAADHRSYSEPPSHTRSVEFYRSSPGSVSERPDGLIPKWWRDVEYVTRGGVRPPVFVLAPCWVFSRPVLWTTLNPRRAALRLTAGGFQETLRT